MDSTAPPDSHAGQTHSTPHKPNAKPHRPTARGSTEPSDPQAESVPATGRRSARHRIDVWRATDTALDPRARQEPAPPHARAALRPGYRRARRCEHQRAA